MVADAAPPPARTLSLDGAGAECSSIARPITLDAVVPELRKTLEGGPGDRPLPRGLRRGRPHRPDPRAPRALEPASTRGDPDPHGRPPDLRGTGPGTAIPERDRVRRSAIRESSDYHSVCASPRTNLHLGTDGPRPLGAAASGRRPPPAARRRPRTDATAPSTTSSRTGRESAPEPEPLGIEQSDAETLTWIGYEEYQEHLARLSEVEQAAMLASPVAGGGGTPPPSRPRSSPSTGAGHPDRQPPLERRPDRDRTGTRDHRRGGDPRPGDRDRTEDPTDRRSGAGRIRDHRRGDHLGRRSDAGPIDPPGRGDHHDRGDAPEEPTSSAPPADEQSEPGARCEARAPDRPRTRPRTRTHPDPHARERTATRATPRATPPARATVPANPPRNPATTRTRTPKPPA